MAYPKTLIGKVATRPNLLGAWEDISRSAKPGSHGQSEQTIQDFRSNLKSDLEIIRKELLDGTYQLGAVRAVTAKKKGGKKRPLRIADIRDRVVQRAITRKLEKPLEKKFNLLNPASYAYLRGRGVQSAIKQMLQYHQAGCRFVFEADIVSFFDTVDIQKLLNEMIFPVLPDTSLQDLITAAFNMEIGNRNDLPEEDWELYPESSTGLPQGGYLSPLFSNVYLSGFDKKMLEANFRLIRYADDFVVLCSSNEEAEKAYDLSRKILEQELGLELHAREDDNLTGRTRIVRPSQTTIQFLGIQFNGARIWPADEKRQKLSQKLTDLMHSKGDDRAKTVSKLLISTHNLLEGWIASYGFTDINKAYADKIDQQVNKNLWIALKRMDWRLDGNSLSGEQRATSGVLHIYNYLHKTRCNLSDRELWELYWTD